MQLCACNYLREYQLDAISPPYWSALGVIPEWPSTSSHDYDFPHGCYSTLSFVRQRDNKRERVPSGFSVNGTPVWCPVLHAVCTTVAWTAQSRRDATSPVPLRRRAPCLQLPFLPPDCIAPSVESTPARVLMRRVGSPPTARRVRAVPGAPAGAAAPLCGRALSAPEAAAAPLCTVGWMWEAGGRGRAG